jgi:CheY-like chemotaxis protein
VISEGWTILVVDDDDDVREVAVGILEDRGYTVLAAGDGMAALDILGSGATPDLLFTDIVMPGGINGFQLAEKAKALRPAIGVLYTSGFVSPLSDTVYHGNLLRKPYRSAQLLEAVGAALHRREGAGNRNGELGVSSRDPGGAGKL